MDRRIREHVHDPYKTRFKLAEPAVCRGCGAVFHVGRWQWLVRPANAAEETCQACRRIADGCPAGFVTLAGAFVGAHKAEIVSLVRHQETMEKSDHPLHRVMGIEEGDGVVTVTTTDIHLPRRIGEALRHAYHGDLDFHYDDESYLLRVQWTREK